MHVVSYGWAGARVADLVRAQLPRALEPLRASETSRSSPGADLVAVVIGSNDATHSTPPRRFRADLRAMLEGIRAAAPRRAGRPCRHPGLPRRAARDRAADLHHRPVRAPAAADQPRRGGRVPASPTPTSPRRCRRRIRGRRRRPVERPVPPVGRRLRRLGRRDRRGAPRRIGDSRHRRTSMAAGRRLTARDLRTCVAPRAVRCYAATRSHPVPSGETRALAPRHRHAAGDAPRQPRPRRARARRDAASRWRSSSGRSARS